MTNRNLLNFHNELEATKGSIYSFLLKSRINDFYNENRIRIQALSDSLVKLQKRYFEFENGIVKLELKDGATDKTPVMLEGKLIEDYVKEEDLIMNKEVSIK